MIKLFKSTNLLNVIFVVFLISVMLSGIGFYFRRIAYRSEDHGIVSSYTDLLLMLRQDSQIASRVFIGSNELVFFDRSDKEIAAYKLENKVINRYVPLWDTPKSLVHNVEFMHCRLGIKLPNLLTVRVHTSDESDLPFLTSFALRGYKK